MLSGIFWADDTCDQETLLYFNTRGVFLKANRISIERSLMWLRKNVFSRKKYGYCIKEFIRTNRSLNRFAEKKLRNSVKYWKKEGRMRINLDIFYKECGLSFDLQQLVKSFVFNDMYNDTDND
jgi:hypothetical protein